MQREVYMFLLNNQPGATLDSFEHYRFIVKTMNFINAYDNNEKKYEALREIADLVGNNFRDQLAALCDLV
jgi:hypothetical protein